MFSRRCQGVGADRVDVHAHTFGNALKRLIQTQHMHTAHGAAWTDRLESRFARLLGSFLGKNALLGTNRVTGQHQHERTEGDRTRGTITGAASLAKTRIYVFVRPK